MGIIMKIIEMAIPVLLGYFLSQFQQFISWKKDKDKQLGLPLINELQITLSKIGNLEILPRQNINNISYFINPKGKVLSNLANNLLDYNKRIINLRYNLKHLLHEVLIVDLSRSRWEQIEDKETIDTTNFPWLYHMLDNSEKIMIERLVDCFLHDDVQDRIFSDYELSSYVEGKIFGLSSEGIEILSFVNQVHNNELKEEIMKVQQIGEGTAKEIQKEIVKLSK